MQNSALRFSRRRNCFFAVPESADAGHRAQSAKRRRSAPGIDRACHKSRRLSSADRPRKRRARHPSFENCLCRGQTGPIANRFQVADGGASPRRRSLVQSKSEMSLKSEALSLRTQTGSFSAPKSFRTERRPKAFLGQRSFVQASETKRVAERCSPAQTAEGRAFLPRDRPLSPCRLRCIPTSKIFRSHSRRAFRVRASAGNDRPISEKSYVLPRGLPSFFWTSTNRYFIVKGLFAAAPTNGNNAHSHFYKDISLWA